MQYSYSRVTCFENCPQAFKFRYIDKLDVERFESIEAFMGSRVHDTLEKFYKDRNLGKIAPINDMLTHYNSLWERQITPEVVVNREGLTQEHYRVVGEKCLVDYYNRYKPFSKGKTIETEMQIRVDLLGDGEYKFIGYIDRLDTRDDNIYEIHDYKTSQRLPTQEIADRDRQLALYELGIRQLWNDVEEVDLVWHYLVFDKEIKSKRSKTHLEELQQDLLGLIHKIEKATDIDDFPAIESGLCGWCEYQEHCKLKKHQVKTRQMPLNKYLKEDGVVLANKYTELKAKEAEFKQWYATEYEQLSEALIAYAKKEGVEFLYGTDKRVSVKVAEAFRFPKSGSKEREELERIIKDKGFWDDVSTLNTRVLDKGLKEHEFNQKLNKIIIEYAKKEETTTIRLTKIKKE